MANNSKNTEDIEFDWIKLQQDMDTLLPTETRQQKLIRKMRENPFVPIGCLATTAALGMGLYSFRQGKKKMSQYMMRTRIAAQGFTVIAMVVGVGMAANKKSELEKKCHRED